MARNKTKVNPKKILRNVRFQPREGFQEELFTRLKEKSLSDDIVRNEAPPPVNMSHYWLIKKSHALVMALVVIAVMLFSCSTSTMANQIINLLQGLSIITLNDNTVVDAGEGDRTSATLLTYEEAQAMVPFKILVPDTLPFDLVLDGFYVTILDGEESGYRVYQGYVSPGGTYPKVVIHQTLGEDITSILVSDQAVHKTKVNDINAYYTIGAWETNNSGEMTWNESTDIVMLFWTDNQIMYTISVDQLNASIEEVISIAEGLMQE